jgi:hypothetical protein
LPSEPERTSAREQKKKNIIYSYRLLVLGLRFVLGPIGSSPRYTKESFR